MTNATKTLTDLVDPDEVAKFAFRVWSYKQGEMVSLLIHLGDRLGLYRVLDGPGMVTADDLAGRTGLHPRWLLEWLRGNAAADLLASEDGERFELTAVGAMVLTREEDSLQFAAGAFGPPPEPALVDELAEAFRTGTGLPYDRQGPTGVHVTERMLGPWARLSLVPTIVPALEGVHDRLAAGALVADVGCGAGVALTALAKTYPRSTFHGYELSRLAVERARARIAEAGLTNVEIIDRRAEESARPRRVLPSAELRLPARHDTAGRGGRRHPACHRRRRNLAGQGDPMRQHLGRQPPQPNVGHVPRLLDRLVHVLGALRARWRRARHNRATAAGTRAAGAECRLYAVPGARLRGPGKPLLRGSTLTAEG